MNAGASDRFLILCEAPLGEDVRSVLVEAGYVAHLVEAETLSDAVPGDPMLGLFIDIPTLIGAAAEVVQALADQPVGSDMPVVVLADRAALPPLDEMLVALGQVRIVELPLDPLLLRRAAASAARSRSRQGSARAALSQQGAVQASYRDMAAELEHRIRQRMAELQAAHERLQESEERYRVTLELSRQTMWTVDASGALSYISARGEGPSGLTFATSLGRGWLDAVHPDDRAPLLEEWRRCVTTGVPYYFEFRLRQLDGSYRLFASRAAPHAMSGSEQPLWYGTSEDIEDRQSTVRALQRTEERYRLAARATNDIIWDWDVLGDRLHWSDAAAAFFGGTITDTPLSWWSDRLHPADRDAAEGSLRVAVAGDANHWEASYRLRRVDGSYAEIFDRGFISRDEHGRAVRAVGAMTDETARREAEAQLQRVQAELIHVSRVSAMGAMASTLAHELNQPLTAITNYIHGSRRLLAEEDGAALPQIADALAAAEASALRAGQIVRRLRELVSRGQVASELASLQRLIAEAGEIAFVDAHLLGITHRVEIADDAGTVEVDRIQIQQVLINLIRNAVQALEDAPRREILVSARPVPLDMVEISVTDTGPGLPAERQRALFTPFNSSKPSGMGIGLSICRTIVEAHGGKIWAEAPPDGAVFRFTVPSGSAALRRRAALQSGGSPAYLGSDKQGE